VSAILYTFIVQGMKEKYQEISGSMVPSKSDRAVGMDTRCLSIRDQRPVTAEFKANSARAPAAIVSAEY